MRYNQSLLLVLLLSLTGHTWADSARTTWGDPNIEGLWDFRTLTPLERPAEFADKAELTRAEAEALRASQEANFSVDGRDPGDAAEDLEGSYNDFWYDWGNRIDRRTSLIVDPPNGRLPALTEIEIERIRADMADRKPPVRDKFSFAAGVHVFKPLGPEWLGLSERCLVGFNAGPPLIPSAYNNNLRIVQTPDHVLLVTEMIHTARVVPLGKTESPPEEFEQWAGVARGRWEKETLVVETTNFSSKGPSFQPAAAQDQATVFGAVGVGSNMHLIERFTRTENGLEYRYTLTDLESFAAPFTVVLNLVPATGKMFEYACHEGNYAMGGVLRGARLLESEENAAAGL